MNEIIVPSPLVGEGEETVFDAHPVGGEFIPSGQEP